MSGVWWTYRALNLKGLAPAVRSSEKDVWPGGRKGKRRQRSAEQHFIAAYPFVAYKALHAYDLLEIVLQQIKKVKALAGWESRSPAVPLNPEETHFTLFLPLLSPHCMVALGPEPWLLMKEGWFAHLPKQVEIKTPIHYRRVGKRFHSFSSLIAKKSPASSHLRAFFSSTVNKKFPNMQNKHHSL